MSIRDPRHRKGANSAANAQIATGKTPNQQKGTKAADHASVDAVDAARRKENAKKGGCGPVEEILRRLAATYVVVSKKGPDVRRRRGEDRIRLPRIHPRASVRSTRRPEPFQIGTFAPVFHGTMFQSRKQIMAVDPQDLTKYKPTILNNSDGKRCVSFSLRQQYLRPLSLLKPPPTTNIITIALLSDITLPIIIA